MRKRVGRPGFESGRRRGASAPSFAPSDLAGLQLWHDATDAASVTLNAGNVAQIDDKSGNARHFAQATASQQPAYVSGQYIQLENGLVAGKDFLTSGVNASTILSTADNTIFVVLQADAGQLANGLGYVRIGSFSGLQSNGTGLLVRLWNGTVGQSDRALALAEGTKYIVTVRRAGAVLAASANGGVEVSGATAGALTALAAPWDIPSPDSGPKAAYRFYEQLCYNVALSVAEVNQVGQYLATKHSLTWTDIS